MSESTLSRQIATNVVEALRAHGHILIVKGGIEALVREIDSLMSAELAAITPRLVPRTVVGEVTSTFGDESVDEAVEEMVGEIGKAFMDSEHVEDVFAEDHVIRRDIFRIVREVLLNAPPTEPDEEEEESAGPISVRLETLGYVAATVAKRADQETLRDALERAALAAQGDLASYDAKAGEATFSVVAGGPDTRLEIEEAVADELADLVDMGLVDLPSIERRIELDREIGTAERAVLRPKIEASVVKTLRRAGCATTWDFAGPRAILVTFTPLSEQDGRGLDPRVEDFTREMSALLAEAAPAVAAEPARSTSDRDVLRRGAEALLDLAKGRVDAPRGAAKPAKAPAPKKEEKAAPTSKGAVKTKAPEVKAKAKPAVKTKSAAPKAAAKVSKPAKKAPAAKKPAKKAAAKKR